MIFYFIKTGNIDIDILEVFKEPFKWFYEDKEWTLFDKNFDS